MLAAIAYGEPVTVAVAVATAPKLVKLTPVTLLPPTKPCEVNWLLRNVTTLP